MPPHLSEFHKSISTEFSGTMDRVQHLIGDAHWPSVGPYRENLLKKILQNRMPGSYITSGFVVLDTEVTRQIDIMIVDRSYPLLLDDCGITIVEPQAVKAIIEVKTKLHHRRQSADALEFLADNIERIRRYNADCVAGLFSFKRSDMESCLDSILQGSARDDRNRVVDLIACGPDYFYRFWEAGSSLRLRGGCTEVVEDSWHKYRIDDLAYAYFLSNVILNCCGNESNSEHLYYPIEEGKERFFLPPATPLR